MVLDSAQCRLLANKNIGSPHRVYCSGRAFPSQLSNGVREGLYLRSSSLGVAPRHSFRVAEPTSHLFPCFRNRYRYPIWSPHRPCNERPAGSPIPRVLPLAVLSTLERIRLYRDAPLRLHTTWHVMAGYHARVTSVIGSSSTAQGGCSRQACRCCAADQLRCS